MVITELDWKRAFFAVLESVGDAEGTYFDESWVRNGMTEDERRVIIDELKRKGKYVE